MSARYNPPPNWPRPPVGWRPPPGWQPDPAWGPPPPGWRLWVEDGVGAAPPGTFPTTVPPANNTAVVAVAAATCGLAGFVPPLWAARRRPHDALFRRRMHLVAACLATLSVVGTVLVGTAEEGPGGSPVGLRGDLGGVLLLVNLVLAVTVAVLVRNTQPDQELRGVAEELRRRELRERHRRVAQADPVLARSIRIGRPDLPREVDDGGLLDLNEIPPQRLVDLAGISADDAGRIERARPLGPFTSVEELALYAELSDATVAVLRERAVFFPR